MDSEDTFRLRLHIKNLDFKVSEDELHHFLSTNFGPIDELTLPKSLSRHSQNRGFGFATFKDYKVGLTALANGFYLRNRVPKFQLEKNSRTTTQNNISSLFDKNVQDSYQMVSVDIGSWVGVKGNGQHQFSTRCTLQSIDPIKLLFGVSPISINLLVCPKPNQKCMIQIPVKNLTSYYGKKLGKIMDKRIDEDYSYMYLSVDLACPLFRSPERSNIDPLLSILMEITALKEKEIRTIDWTGGDLAFNRCEVFRLMIKNEDLLRFEFAVNQKLTTKQTTSSINYARIEQVFIIYTDARARKEFFKYLTKHSFIVYYYLEVFFSHGIFHPEEFDQIPKLIDEFKSYIERGKEKLVVDTLYDLYLLRRIKWNPTKANHKRPIYLFMSMARKNMNKRRRDNIIDNPDSDFINIHAVTVTPTSLFVEFPVVEQGNRVLRQYRDKSDRFLRVNFAEEDGDKLGSIFDGYLRDIINHRVLKILKEGLTIAGRKYNFLAFSSSQLRNHSVWMFCDGNDLTSEKIRSWMGDFSQIKVTAKYAARMGQCFTTTYQTIDIPETSVKKIPEIERIDWKTNKKYIFSDGIGKISPALLIKAMMSYRAYRSKSDELPSACQIRFGGCKGMIAVDNTLVGEQLHIRDSMEKFPVASSRSFEIVKTSRVPRIAYMNRQLISILSFQRVDDDVFLKYQKSHTTVLNKISNDLESARSALIQGIGGGSNIVGVVLDLFAEKIVISNKFDVLNEPFISAVLEISRLNALKDVKERARFP
ncbi:hypothetical protein HK096_005432, partial [Nowakowskiella sp. JEL0078]